KYTNVRMKNMCVSAGISILFNQVRYEHPHHEKDHICLFDKCGLFQTKRALRHEKRNSCVMQD
ncbi:MAG: hypothetical protein ACI3VQ_00875, partial [Faecousia sp.]